MPEDKVIRPRGEMPRIPIANTIQPHTIISAVVYEDREARAYIREYGRLCNEVLSSVMKEGG